MWILATLESFCQCVHIGWYFFFVLFAAFTVVLLQSLGLGFTDPLVSCSEGSDQCKLIKLVMWVFENHEVLRKFILTGMVKHVKEFGSRLIRFDQLYYAVQPVELYIERDLYALCCHIDIALLFQILQNWLIYLS